MSKETIVTGIKPTGRLHLGNYLGALRNCLRLQEDYAGHCFFFIADYHAMTDEESFNGYSAFAKQLAIDLIALGLDPKRATLFFQRDVPEATELAWMFNTVTPTSFLERMTQYKDKMSRRESPNAGLFTYPVLQAADILIYGGPAGSGASIRVPVGEDQIQHVELTRDIVRFWNNRFGKTFEEPKPLLTKTPRVMALNFPERKMSKSLPGSMVYIADTPDEIRAAVRRAVTDSAPVPKGEMSPGVTNLFALLTEFAPEGEVKKFTRQHADGSIRYSQLKDAVADHIANHFADFREKRVALMKKPDQVEKIFKAGAKKARLVAALTMARVRKQIGF